MERDYTHIPIQELLPQYPYIRDFFISLNIKRNNFENSLAEILDTLRFDDFQECGMGKDEILAYFNHLIAKMEDLSTRRLQRVDSITILGGKDKSGQKEQLHLRVVPGDVISIVGPTGSGKSRFLEDIEFLAQGDTPTGRQILLNDTVPGEECRFSAENSLVAQLSQNMNFVMDLGVADFLSLHAESRGVGQAADLVAEIIACANRLAGEPFDPSTSLTQLSGGQSRALMIADTAMLSASPVVLIDEIENAGVDRQAALELLVRKDKVVFVSTHDPLLALMGQKRLVIQNGGVQKVIPTTEKEKENLAFLTKVDGKILALREALRRGQSIDFEIASYFGEVLN